MPPRRRSRLLVAPVFALLLVLAGCGAHTAPGAPPQVVAGVRSDDEGSRGPAGAPAAPAPPAPPVRPLEIPGLGPGTRAQIPVDARQAFVVTGRGADSNESTAVLYARDAPDRSWTPVFAPWAAHNGMEGWTDEHYTGDLRSPVGVFGLTDAGGKLPDPGTLLPYDEEEYFAVEGDGFFGEPLAGSFDYVVAINYNRVEGVSPIDHERPLGEDRGGGIWIHVDHGGPTQGCVSVSEDRMKELLLTLDPEKKPVVVMGDKASLAR
ncbi:L,D-transpeptidase family protein [Streptomyces sp. NBC_00247]|uniref:L,D-transpeptidase family protein n=1 Tax=Streptomyces sp. NBC_00247 TaxID=2975689 RepID=UPI002E290A46|nr:L,D-transpeptidase family protein [Streptomyces sp. NBC_00247]